MKDTRKGVRPANVWKQRDRDGKTTRYFVGQMRLTVCDNVSRSVRVGRDETGPSSVCRFGHAEHAGWSFDGRKPAHLNARLVQPSGLGGLWQYEAQFLDALLC